MGEETATSQRLIARFRVDGFEPRQARIVHADERPYFDITLA
jgi:hypothetical protein